jgi:cell division protein FtsW (lipid II flippase)
LALQPDFGSILILAPLLVALYFVGGGNPRFIILIFLIAAMGAGSVYGLGKLGGEESRSKLSYITKRIDSFFQSSETLFATKESSNQDYQIKQ